MGGFLTMQFQVDPPSMSVCFDAPYVHFHYPQSILDESLYCERYDDLDNIMPTALCRL